MIKRNGDVIRVTGEDIAKRGYRVAMADSKRRAKAVEQQRQEAQLKQGITDFERNKGSTPKTTVITVKPRAVSSPQGSCFGTTQQPKPYQFHARQ